jgi:hypothetical protein
MDKLKPMVPKLDPAARQTQNDVPHLSATNQPLQNREPPLNTSHSEDILSPDDNHNRDGTPEVYEPAENDHRNATHDESFQLGLVGPSASASIADLTRESGDNDAKNAPKHKDIQELQDPQQNDATSNSKKGKEPARSSSDTMAVRKAIPSVTFDRAHDQSESSEDEVVWKGRMRRNRAAALVTSKGVPQPLASQMIIQSSHNAPYQPRPMAAYYSPVPYYDYYTQRPPFGLQYAPVNPLLFPSAYWSSHYPVQSPPLAGPSTPRHIGAPAENTRQQDTNHVSRVKSKLSRVEKGKRPKARTLKRTKHKERDVSKIVDIVKPEALNSEDTDPLHHESTRPIRSTQHTSPSGQLAQIRYSSSEPFLMSSREDDLSPAQPSATRDWQDPRSLYTRSMYRLGTDVAASTPAFATWRRAGSARSLPTHKAALRALPRLCIPGASELGEEERNTDLAVRSVRKEPLMSSAVIRSPHVESASNKITYWVDRDADAHAVTDGLVIPVAVQCSHATLYSRFSTLLHSNWPERSAPSDDGNMFVKKARHAKRMKKRDGSHSIELTCDNGPSSNGQQSEYRLQWL